MSTPLTEQSLAAYRATVCHIPAQLGRLTLFQAAQLSDAIGNIRVCCHHAFQYETGQDMPAHYVARMDKGIPSGDKLTLAQSERIVTKWCKWTHQHRDFPSLSSVTGFLFDL